MQKRNNVSETAVFGGGCFWCTEAVFQELAGVESVESGYAGGKMEHPSYEQVSGGATGHAEVIKVTFDPKVISYKELLEVFFAAHDPTTKDRQGNDVGTQYRSLILYADDGQKKDAQEAIRMIDASKEYPNPVVTQVLPLGMFYPAEAYHQDFYIRNAEHPYCEIVIDPKLDKVRAKYSKLIKKNG